MTKIIIVDDQISIREFLKVNLATEPDFQVVGWAEDGQSAITQVETHQPEIVLMDIEMPNMDGIVATQIISQQFPSTKILLFTSRDDRKQLNLALQAGARGYILKNTSPQDIAHIIRLTEKGFFQIGPILTDWNYGNTDSVETQIYESQQQTSIVEVANGDGNGYQNGSSMVTKGSSVMSKESDMQQVLSNLTSGIFQLQETIQNQESTIVQLTNQYATVQQEIKSKLNNLEMFDNLRLPGYRGKKQQPNWTKRKQNSLFITSFLLGVATVSILIVLLIGLQMLLP